MNAAQIAKRILLLADCRTLAEANTNGAEYIDAAVDAINQATQQIYANGPAWLNTRPYGFPIEAPTTTSMTESSGKWQIAGDKTAWLGRSFLIAGQPQNRFVNATFATGTTTASPMSAPPASFTGTVQTLTVYHDAIVLPAEITKVMPSVVLDDSIYLEPASSESQLNSQSSYFFIDYGRRRRDRYRAAAPMPGMPRAYMIETIAGQSPAGPTLTRILRLSPWPNKAGHIRMQARIAPPNITTAQIDAANNGAACTAEIPIPNGWHELYLLPIAKQIFMGSPFANSTVQREEIGRAYQAAIDSLRNSESQQETVINFAPTI